MPENTHRLTDAEIDEIALCRTGINGESKMLLFKAVDVEKGHTKSHKKMESCSRDHAKMKKGEKCEGCGYKVEAHGKMHKAEETDFVLASARAVLARTKKSKKS